MIKWSTIWGSITRTITDDDAPLAGIGLTDKRRYFAPINRGK